MIPPALGPAAAGAAAPALLAAREIPTAHTLISFLAGFALLVAVVELIRRNRLQERYAALWILMALVSMTYRLWLGPVQVFADRAEIGDPVTVVLVLGILMCALLILQLSVKVSEFSGRIKNLAQEVALLEHERERGAAPDDAAGPGAPIDPGKSGKPDKTGKPDKAR